MLQLQRASAGSGKTYLLAKKYIEYFISYKTDKGRRLRPLKSLRDSLTHILAITFTNKATTEMKLRIVDKLDALAHWTPAIPTRKVDYLDEFVEEFDADPADIARTCEVALQALLNDYGDFKVSTIDSFFQTVLRTFAYEADLDDTYQIELDSDYVAQVGLDTALDEIEDSDTSAGRGAVSAADQGTAWILNLIDEKSEEGNGWNIFQKKYKKGNLYARILDTGRNLSKEDFKLIREDLDRYFHENPDFFTTYHRLKDIYEKEALRRFARMRKAARTLRKGFADAGIDIKAKGGLYLDSRSLKYAEGFDWDHNKEADLKISLPEFTRKGAKTRVFNPKTASEFLDTEMEDRLEALAIDMYAAFDDWRSEIRSDKMSRWLLYRDTLPYIGILQTVRDNSREFLNGVNAVELAETNSILGRIIADDDAPFVYERLGSRLEHFLIDEFQDTSRLQWNNLRPLVAESEGRGNDNLIIGDAKQSIYRFRNADPSLITTRVPEEFKASVRECGGTPKENTNWRSMRRIVEFNNLFFRYFSRTLSQEMEALYFNTVQPPHHTEDSGYVEVRLFQKKADEEVPSHFAEIPLLIEDMLDRGYRQSDIAVLVDRREDGRNIIDSIIAHNRKEDARRHIDFISADSLTVGDSTAVMTVVSVLEAIDKGTRPELRTAEDTRGRGVGDWSRLKADFSFFSMSHRDLPLSEQMRRFLDGEYDPDIISGMLSGMQTTVLPALVESICEKFLPESVRDAQAPFLAAFQDLVLDFCDSRSADIASFLQWWEMRGKSRSISSPDGADAVQVMTVHKSKGLEFRCVIVPNSKQRVAPSPHEKEWLWVEPDLSEAADIPSIPWIPVWSNAGLENTGHAAVKESYLKKYLADKVNMAYVAYTRAVDELYIFAPCGKQKEGKVGKEYFSGYLWECAVQATEIIDSLTETYPGIEDYIPAPEDISVNEEDMVWSLGRKPGREEVDDATESRRKAESDVVSRVIDRYPSCSNLSYLRYRDPASPETDFTETASDLVIPEETEDQRRRGEILHAVMEHVHTPGDLHGALQRIRSRGLIGYLELKEYEEFLGSALNKVESYGWFEPGLRLLCERGIAVKGACRRPDRVILRPDGSATIIDYKFGDKRADKAYSRQLRGYANALAAVGLAKKCEAYIWYVGLGEVVKSF